MIFLNNRKNCYRLIEGLCLCSSAPYLNDDDDCAGN